MAERQAYKLWSLRCSGGVKNPIFQLNRRSYSNIFESYINLTFMYILQARYMLTSFYLIYNRNEGLFYDSSSDLFRQISQIFIYTLIFLCLTVHINRLLLNDINTQGFIWAPTGGPQSLPTMQRKTQRGLSGRQQGAPELILKYIEKTHRGLSERQQGAPELTSKYIGKYKGDYLGANRGPQSLPENIRNYKGVVWAPTQGPRAYLRIHRNIHRGLSDRQNISCAQSTPSTVVS